MDKAQAQQLIDGYLDQTLTPEQLEELNGLLRDHPKLVHVFTQAAETDHLLSAAFTREEMEQGARELIAGLPGSDASSQPSRYLIWQKLREIPYVLSRPTPFSLSMAALFVCLVLTAMAFIAAPFYRQVVERDSSPGPAGTYTFVGQITYLHDIKFASGQTATDRGDFLQAGHRLEIASGMAEVTLKSGARLVIEGPALVELPTINSAVLDHGQVVAHVSEQAIGFQLSTPFAQIVDLGTSFGAASAKDSTSVTVEVFEGLIELRFPHGSAPRRLSSGERLTLDRAGIAPRTKDTTFARYAPGSPHEPPELVALYTFEGHANDVSGNGHHATVVSNVEFVAGYEGQAARFAGAVDSYIDIPINASTDAMPSMTWGAWVKLDVVSGSRHTVLSTDDGGFDRTLSFDERSLVSSDQIGDSVPLKPAAFVGYGVLPANIEAQADHWYFVAATYDQPSGSLRLFVKDVTANGRATLTSLSDTTFGASEDFVRIGMHARGLEESLDGCVDCVFVMRGRLSYEQAESICQGGAEALTEFADQSEDADSTLD